MYAQCARPGDALAMLEVVEKIVPDIASHAYLRGTIALNLGLQETAKAALIVANRERPSSGQIYQTLSMLGSLRNQPDIVEIIIGAKPRMATASNIDRAAYLYALGKTYDDLGETDRAFAAFSEGALLVSQIRRYDPIADAVQSQAAISGWTASRIEAVGRGIKLSTNRPIIVAGLPRSGSTLAEHILTSHSAVTGGGELGRFVQVADEVGGVDFSAFDLWERSHPASEASRTYLYLITQRFGNNGRVVDKTLAASRYLGLLAAVMPEAPIVWMCRNPLDTAWSCFSTWFSNGLPWSWSQEAIAQHFALEDRLLGYWETVLGKRLKVVRYEDLVNDKHRVIPEILEHSGLSVEQAVFSPEANQRLVATASVSQVRNPINNHAVGRAQRYAAHLQPFIDRYQALFQST